MLSEPEIAEAAQALEVALADRSPIEPLTDRWPAMTPADAYAVQEAMIGGRLAAGDRRIGWKVGLTSAAMQRQLGVAQPDFGPLLDSMDLGGGECDPGGLIQPRVEGEIAFMMREGLDGTEISIERVLAACERVVPAIEVIDSRIAGWRIRLADTIADHASCARFAIGGPGCAPLDCDLGAVRMSFRIDGEEVDSGAGAAVLGHPASAVAWLAETLAPLGERIEPGEIVLAGALTAAVPAAPDSEVEAVFEGPLGSASVRFAAAEAAS